MPPIIQEVQKMYDLRPNLEPGNPDGHTVLRYLVEDLQMPLEAAIERVYKAVSKFAQEYRSEQNKLMTGMVVSGVLGLPIFFPFGVPSLLIAGAIAGSVFRWQELGTMRDRLKPEYSVLKSSVLLEQFIKWLAAELRERREQAASTGQFQPDALTPANIIAAYEHTVFAVTNGEHLENNASDPILALFVLKLRQHTNHLPSWVIDAFRQLEQAEVQRANDVARASLYMWGNLEERYPERFNQPPQAPQIGQNTRLGAVDVPSQSVQGEGENRLGKPLQEIRGELPATPQITFDELTEIGNRAISDLAYTSYTILFLGTPGSGKTTAKGTILGRMCQRFGNRLKLYAIAMKNDFFGGAIVGMLNQDSDVCWEIFKEVITELRYRASMFSGVRRAYCEANPVRLILDDYVSQQKQFDTVLKDKKVAYPEASGRINSVKFGDAVDAILSEISFNGRELNVSAIVGTQSGNISDLTFLSSKSGRAAITLMILALRNTEKRQGNYEVISQSINNAQLIASEDERRRLKEVFPRCKELSLEHQQPMVLTSNSETGEYALGIVPNLVAEYEGYQQEDKEVRSNVLGKVASGTPTNKEERKLVEEEEMENASFKVSDDLAEPLKTIWLFAKKKKTWVTTKDVYNNGFSVLKGKSVKNIRQYFGLLADSGHGEIDEMDGDNPKSDSAVGFRAY
jgi:hypothetical protein